MTTMKRSLCTYPLLLIAMVVLQAQPLSNFAFTDGQQVKIVNKASEGIHYRPLEEINLIMPQVKEAFISVRDGKGVEYYRAPAQGQMGFQVGGALGTHSILLLDKNGTLLDHAAFGVNCKTELKDENGEFANLLNLLHNSMITDESYGKYLYDNKVYYTFDGWFQDNVHTSKGLKYFESNVKDFVDLFAEGQREDGMIYDNYYQPYKTNESWLDRFGKEWLKIPDDPSRNSSFFVRIPIENEPEFSFLEAVYYVWKATGDDEWMKKRLENCLKAIQYTTTDKYRWSDKFRLTRRAYTIDIWDFQCREDASLYRLGDIMKAELGKTRFGISYADNLGMAVGCEYVAEMLDYAGRHAEAEQMNNKAVDWRKRTDELCWNGSFYRHWVPEDPAINRDFGGTDEFKQVSLSNTYVLNRRLSHDKAVAIIKTYQRIREEMPKTSPGEWYLLYPPYEKGWHLPKWEYMNGGVSPITAGELSHGAYENGYEDYATDILRRIAALAKRSGNRLYNTYKGSLMDSPKRHFTPLNLKEYANADFRGDESTASVCSWTGEDIRINDMINFPTGNQTFHEVSFDIIDPAKNGRKACLILSADKGYMKTQTININAKASSLYLVHAKSGGNYAGYLKLNYDDGSSFRQDIINGQQLAGWWYPEDGERYKIAWKGPNRFCISVGMYIWGLNNPFPGKMIKSVEFSNDNEHTKWMIAGLTLCDAPVYFDPGIVSYGIPDNWADAAVIYALIEGLVGIKDAGVAFNKAILAPRWASAEVNRVSTTIKYEASGGYVSYNYAYEPSKSSIQLSFTGSASNIRLKLLLPKDKTVSNVVMDNKPIDFKIEAIEMSNYAVIEVNSTGVHKLNCNLKP